MSLLVMTLSIGVVLAARDVVVFVVVVFGVVAVVFVAHVVLVFLLSLSRLS